MKEKLALVVEDESNIRGLFTIMLEEVGFRVATVYSVSTAFESLKEQVPDIVILDLMLPGVGSGSDILTEIRSDPRLAKTKVAVVTAYPEKAADLHSKADLVLIKPVGYKQLQELILRLATEVES